MKDVLMSPPRSRQQPADPDRAAHRVALETCYRMLGSVVEASEVSASVVGSAAVPPDENVGPQFALDSLLARAVTECVELTARDRRHRRVLTVSLPRGARVTLAAQVPWLQPLADQSGDDGAGVDLASVVALQHLSPVQRACVVLRYSLGWTNSRTADVLGLSRAGAQSTTQRGRDALRARLGPARAGDRPPDVGSHREVAERYCRAVERADRDAVSGILHYDVVVSHQPYAAGNDRTRPAIYRGREAVLESWSPLFAEDEVTRLRAEVVGNAGGLPVVLTSLRAPSGDVEPFALEVLAARGGRIHELANFGTETARYFDVEIA